MWISRFRFKSVIIELMKKSVQTVLFGILASLVPLAATAGKNEAWTNVPASVWIAASQSSEPEPVQYGYWIGSAQNSYPDALFIQLRNGKQLILHVPQHVRIIFSELFPHPSSLKEKHDVFVPVTQSRDVFRLVTIDPRTLMIRLQLPGNTWELSVDNPAQRFLTPLGQPSIFQPHSKRLVLHFASAVKPHDPRLYLTAVAKEGLEPPSSLHVPMGFLHGPSNVMVHVNKNVVDLLQKRVTSPTLPPLSQMELIRLSVATRSDLLYFIHPDALERLWLIERDVNHKIESFAVPHCGLFSTAVDDDFYRAAHVLQNQLHREMLVSEPWLPQLEKDTATPQAAPSDTNLGEPPCSQLFRGEQIWNPRRN